MKAADALAILKEPSVYSELKEAHANSPQGSRAAIELAMLATGADASTCKTLISSSANVGVAEAAFIALLKKTPPKQWQFCKAVYEALLCPYVAQA